MRSALLPVVEAERRRDRDALLGGREAHRALGVGRRAGRAVEAVAERQDAGARDAAHVGGAGFHCGQRHTSGTPRACAVTHTSADAPAMNRLAHLLRRGAALAIPLALLAPSAAQGADTIVVGLRPGAVVGDRAERIRRRPGGSGPEASAPSSCACRRPAGAAALRALRRSRAVRYAEPQRRLRALETRQPDPGRAQQWGLDAVGVGRAWLGHARRRRRRRRRRHGGRPAPDLAGRLLPGWNVIDGSDDAGRRQRPRHARRRHDRGGRGQRAGRVRRRTGGVDPARQGARRRGHRQRRRRRCRHRLGGRSRCAIVNLSLGGGESSTVLADAVVYARHKGVLIVAAAGNDGGTVGVPARLAGVLAVGAVDVALVRAPFSAGGRSLDLVAPGVGILQQTLDGAGGYADRSFSGTSMATPHVAGSRGARARSRARDDGGRRRPAADADGARPRPAGQGYRLRRRARARGRGGRRPRAAGTLRACRVVRPPIPRSRGRSGCSGWTLLRAPRRSAAPGRSGWRARTPTATPSAPARRRASPPRSTRRASCASGGSRRASRGPSRCRPRRCARRSRSASCARPRARPSRTARRSAPATSCAARAGARSRSRAACSRCARAGTDEDDARRARRRLLRRARPISCPSPTAAPCAASAAARPSSDRRCAPAPSASRSSCGSSARIAPSSPRCAASARAPARAARPRPSSAIGSRGARARALPLGRGVGRPPARGAPRASMLAAYAHAYALWAAGSTARDAEQRPRLEAPQAP